MKLNKPQRNIVSRLDMPKASLREINTDYSGKLIPNTLYLIPNLSSAVYKGL